MCIFNLIEDCFLKLFRKNFNHYYYTPILQEDPDLIPAEPTLNFIDQNYFKV